MVVSGFDYLRDNLALSREEAVLSQRPLDKAYCLVDEVCHYLIFFRDAVIRFQLQYTRELTWPDARRHTAYSSASIEAAHDRRLMIVRRVYVLMCIRGVW
jgi:hypothetical protein